MAEACRKAPLPDATEGKHLEIFALENRRAAHMANRAVGDCQAFYADVRREFGE
ncbi:hypothetical protein [Methylocystis parvus]|uniref:hypothetical protein n=1 Tax=Methylocystis parvus TaxID=134 RepID=UPI003C72238A